MIRNQHLFRRRLRLAAGAGLIALAASGASPLWAQTASASSPENATDAATQSAPTVAAPPTAAAPTMPGETATAPASSQESGLGDIVVTARRVSENLQDVPISVGVLTPATLNNRQIFGINDLKGSVAGLTASRTTTPGSGYFTIRGTTSIALPTPSVDNTVGFYIDGVYIARSEGQGVDIPDLARVEVLRGPQGTLFGRNSAAGAINFVTNTPTNKLELKYDALYGNYDHLRTSVIANVPIADGLAVRVAYQHNEIDGDVRNTTTRPGQTYAGYGSFTPVKRFGAANDDSVIGRVRYTGIQNLTLDYKYDYNKLVETAGANQVIGFLPDAQAGGFNALLGIIYPSQTTVPTSFKRLSALPEGDQGKSPIISQGHLFTAEYLATDNITLKNISAWRKLRASLFADLDGADWTPGFLGTLPGASSNFNITSDYNNLKQTQFSQENQIIAKFGNLNFIVGGYYFVEHSRFTSIYNTVASIPDKPGVYNVPTGPTVCLLNLGTPPACALASVPGPFALGEDGRYRNASIAGYVHADYQFNDVFKLSAGGRYTNDKRKTEDLRSFGTPGTQKVSYNRFTYDASLNAQLDPSKLLYVKYATGYVSGGISGNIPFKPEDDKQVEVGFKTEWWDRKLRVNASAYYTWRKDIQNALPSTSETTNAVLAGAGYTAPYPLGILVYNTPGTTKIKGFEIETTLAPIEGVTLTANYGYNDPHYSDGSFYRAPKQTFSFSGEYDLPKFDNGSYLLFRLDGDYRSKYYGTGANVAGFFTGDVNPALRAGYATSEEYLAALRKASFGGDYWLVNGRAALADIPLGGSTAKISGFVQNMFNEKGLLYTVNYGFSINGSFERPRTYGLEVNMAF